MASRSVSLNFTLPDGAKLGYDIFGSEQLGHKRPIILIGGMSNHKIDWERLIEPLSLNRPVLVFDHRGMGESTYSTPARNDDITIEVMARDLLALIEHLDWKDVDILGFSMGGVILEQLLLFPGHPSQPISLPFRVHHALLTGTLCSPINIEIPAPQKIPGSHKPGKRLTVEQKKELVRPMFDASLGPSWVTRAENRERYEWWLERMINGRPQRTILKQQATLGTFDFRQQLGRLSPFTKVLVIHGEQDLIVPFAAGMQVLASIPHARTVGVGSSKGQVPNLDFGHIWYEYFHVDVWTGVIEAFVDDEHNPSEKARL